MGDADGGGARRRRRGARVFVGAQLGAAARRDHGGGGDLEISLARPRRRRAPAGCVLILVDAVYVARRRDAAT